MGKIKFDCADAIVTLLASVVLIIIGGVNWWNSALYVLVFYILSLATYNWNYKYCLKQIDIAKANNTESNINSYINYIDSKNFSSYFVGLKIMFGLLFVMILVIMHLIKGSESTVFTISCSVDLLLMPLIQMYIMIFSGNSNKNENGLKGFYNNLYAQLLSSKYKLLKHILATVFLIIALLISIFAILYTIFEFKSKSIATIVIGIIIAIYSIISSKR